MATRKPLVSGAGAELIDQLQAGDTLSTADMTDSSDKRFVNESAARDLLVYSTGVNPTLDLDFGRQQYRRYNGAKGLETIADPFSSLITFTRASTATYFGPDGLLKTAAVNEPRVDYDPATGECLGLLIEDEGENVVKYSKEVGNTAHSWGLNNCTAALNAAVSPDGTTTSTEITSTSSAGEVRPRQDSLPIAAGEDIFVSCFYKLPPSHGMTNPCVRLSIKRVIGGSDNFFASSIYSLLTNSFLTNVDMINYGAVLLPNGWIEVWVVADGSSNTLTATTLYLNMSDGSTNRVPVGAKLLYWGAHVGNGSNYQSHIPTTTAAVIKSADVPVISGSNFTPWWNATEGSISLRADQSSIVGVSPLAHFSDATANEIIALRGNVANPELYIVDGGVSQAQIDAGTITAQSQYGLSAGWKLNDCAASKDGAAAVTDTSVTLPTVSQLSLGSDGANYLNGHLGRVTYYPKRLSNSQLQELSR